MPRHFSTDRLSIIQIGCGHKAEIAKMVRWLNDPETVKYSEQRHLHHNEQSQADYIAERLTAGHAYWGIYIPVQGIGLRLIGTISASIDRMNMVANLGILLGEERGWGYGKEAWAAAMALLKREGFKIEAGMMAANGPMIKTCLSCGMVEEARIKDHFLWNGQSMDMVLMGASR